MVHEQYLRLFFPLLSPSWTGTILSILRQLLSFTRVSLFVLADIRSESGDVVATSENLEVEDAIAFTDSVAAIRRHLLDGSSDEIIFEVRALSHRFRWSLAYTRFESKCQVP